MPGTQDRKHLTTQEAANLSWDDTYDVFAPVLLGLDTNVLRRIAVDSNGAVKIDPTNLDTRYVKLNGGTYNSYVWPNADGAASTYLKTDGAGNLSWQVGGGSYTDEEAQDAIGTILTDTATIDFTYDDVTPKITADVINGSITLAKMANMATASLIYRKTAGAGAPEVNTLTTLKTDLLLTGTNSGDQDLSGLQPLDADLTAIAALGFTATAFLKKTAANTWALDTATYLTAEADTLATVMARGATTGIQLASTLATGTSPFAITSTTLNTNLNADKWDSQDYPLTTIGDILYAGNAGIASRLAANATATNKYLQSVSGGSPSWQQIASADLSDFNEAAQDAVGTILTDSASIDFTYSDVANTITAVVLPAGVDHASLANLNSASYTHLSATNATDLTDGEVSSLHRHTHNLMAVTTHIDVNVAYTPALGDVIARGTTAWYGQPGNTTTTPKFLRSTGDGALATAPEFAQVAITDLAAFTSAALAGVVSDETGSGLLVFATNPTLSGLTMADNTNVVLNATTGTKIGTATSQKLAFYNSTPVIQQTGSALTALSTLGLVASPTITRSIELMPRNAIVPSTGYAQVYLDVTGTNITYDYILLADGANKDAFWQFTMPTNYDGGSLSVSFYWLLVTTTNANIDLAPTINSASDNDVFDAAMLAVVTAGAQTYGGVTHAAGDVAVTTVTWSSNKPTAGDIVSFRLRRRGGQAGDTVNEDVKCLGVKIEYAINS